MSPEFGDGMPAHSLISKERPAALATTSAYEIARHIRERTLSPVQVLEEHLEAIAELNPKLNAFIEVRAEQALHEAHLAEEKIDKRETVGPLHGVPLSIKSSIAVAGCKHEAGSVTRAGLRATEDASLVKRLKEAGAIILGVTNTPEMLMAYETQNGLYGRTNSPWDVERTPG